MSDSSESDHIGRVGERYFDLMADKEKLLVGQILPDRFGRDRILEFELEARSSFSYDKRSPPLGCSIQIKTTRVNKDRVSLSLSVAERLAGDTRPTFICIIRINEDDELVDMYLVHILSGNLERILKRLREEYSKENDDLNKASISFSISAGVVIDGQANALKRALKSLIDVDMETYAIVKAKQRRSLGFQNDGFLTGSVSFNVKNKEELVDGFLGLKKIKVTDFQMFEERFEIKLPFDFPEAQGFKPEFMEANPNPVAQVYLCFHDRNTGERSEVFCGMYLPGLPGLPFEDTKFLIKSRYFRAVASSGKFSLESTTEIGEGDQLTLHEWMQHLSMWQIVSASDFDVEVKMNDGKPLFKGHAEMPMVEKRDFSQQLTLLRKFSDIRNAARVEDRPVELFKIFKSDHRIELIHEFFHNPSDIGEFKFTVVGDQFEPAEDAQALFIDTLIVGSETFAYGLNLDVNIERKGEEFYFTSHSMRPLELANIAPTNDELSAFGQRLCRITGVKMQVVMQIDESSC